VNPAFISVVIPTLNRKEPLLRALKSAVTQKLPEGVRHEIVIIDNSTDQNARPDIDHIKTAFSLSHPHVDIRYISEPNPGAANARNAGVAAAKGEWIAFLDDDEEATPNWIAGFLIAAQQSQADALFGPVAVAAEAKGQTLGIFGSLFFRQYEMIAGADLTDRCAYLGTNNSFFSVKKCFRRPKPFNPEMNACGGEDSLLLKQLVMDGRRLAWAADAKVTEWVPSRRLTWDYYRKRKYLSGQIRTSVYSLLDKPRWERVALWMGIGAVQFLACGAGALAYALVSPDRARALSAQALGGLGKVFWMKPFREQLYGVNLVS
jgi:succinoglycan biosynthesis protein ExoM